MDLLFALTEEQEPTRLLMAGWDKDFTPTVWTEAGDDTILKPLLPAAYQVKHAKKESHTFETYFPGMSFGWYTEPGDPDPRARLAMPEPDGRISSTYMRVTKSNRTLPPDQWPEEYGSGFASMAPNNLKTLAQLLGNVIVNTGLPVEQHDF